MEETVSESHRHVTPAPLGCMPRWRAEEIRVLELAELLERIKDQAAESVRQAARNRKPLDGSDAQALEHALAITERERDAARQKVASLEEQYLAEHDEAVRQFGRAEDAAELVKRLQSERDLLYRQACLWYDADGNEHMMPSASHAISARKAAARRLWELEAERDRYRDALEFVRINLGYLSGLYGGETLMRAVRDHVQAALEGEGD